jgi:heme-degrading monooxygenase HmoA
MFARATRIEGSPDRLEDAIRQFREQTLPAAQGQAGFSGGMLLADRSSGAAMAVTLWESEENMHASERFADEQRTQVASAAGASSQPRVEHYEVAVPLG